MAALEEAGIAQTGLPGKVTVVAAGGQRSPSSASPLRLDQLADRPRGAAALVEAAAEQEEIVVVAIHAGAEGSDAGQVTGATEIYLGQDRGNPEEFAHLAVDAGADLVLGSGPHVLRGIELPRPPPRLQPRQLQRASTTSRPKAPSASPPSSTSPSTPTAPSAPAASPRCG